MNESAINTSLLQPTDQTTIDLIARWYLDEWDIPGERTVRRLSTMAADDILFQLVLNKDGVPVATGGLYHMVGLLMEHPRFKIYDPWVALLHTSPQYRNQGLGKVLLDEIEKEAKAKSFSRIYLFTFTAESLYLRNGWQPMERLQYKGHDTVVMEKRFENLKMG